MKSVSAMFFIGPVLYGVSYRVAIHQTRSLKCAACHCLTFPYTLWTKFLSIARLHESVCRQIPSQSGNNHTAQKMLSSTVETMVNWPAV